MAYLLRDRFLNPNPSDVARPSSDRFILSEGHTSALLYSLLDLTGYEHPWKEVKRFRQWGTKMPGHPEHDLTVQQMAEDDEHLVTRSEAWAVA